jgi:hypothetical protein
MSGTNTEGIPPGSEDHALTEIRRTQYGISSDSIPNTPTPFEKKDWIRRSPTDPAKNISIGATQTPLLSDRAREDLIQADKEEEEQGKQSALPLFQT